MRKARKKPMVVQAYRLGDESPVVDILMAKGEIRQKADGSFEIFSRETKDNIGESAHSGDYIKLDSKGCPYPNSAEYFENSHRHLAADLFEQCSPAVDVWMYGDPMCPEIRYLIEHRHLSFHEDDPGRYFQAPLWGTKLSAAKDAVIIFYRIVRDPSGKIMDADYNFVAGDEFVRTYEMLSEE